MGECKALIVANIVPFLSALVEVADCLVLKHELPTIR